VSRPICSAMTFYLYTVLYPQCHGSVPENSVISVVLWLCISIESHTVPHVNFYGFVSVYSVIFVVLWLCICRHGHINSAMALYLQCRGFACVYHVMWCYDQYLYEVSCLQHCACV